MPEITFAQFSHSAQYRDALQQLEGGERTAFETRMREAFDNLAGLNGGQDTIDDKDLTRVAELFGSDVLVSSGDLEQIGVGNADVQRTTLAILRGIADRQGAFVSTEGQGGVKTRPTLRLVDNVTEDVGSNRRQTVRLSTSSTPELVDLMNTFGAQASVYDQFVDHDTFPTLASWQQHCTQAKEDLRLGEGGPVFEITSSNPDEIRRYLAMGYVPVAAETTGTTGVAPTVEVVREQGLHGSDEFFELGRYALSPTALRELDRMIESFQGSNVSNLVITSSTDQVRVSDPLWNRMQSELGDALRAAGYDPPTSRAEDPTGNLLLSMARNYQIRQYLTTHGVPESALGTPDLRANGSTTGNANDPASRFVDVSFNRSVEQVTPGETDQTITSLRLVKPRTSELPKVTPTIVFAVDRSPSMKRNERMDMLARMLEALDRQGVSPVSITVFTFDNQGNIEEREYTGSPASVVTGVANFIITGPGRTITAADIRAHVVVPSSGSFDGGSRDEPLDEVTDRMRELMRDLGREGAPVSALILTDVDPDRTQDLRDAGFQVFNPAE